jgi:hypothetical protein
MVPDVSAVYVCVSKTPFGPVKSQVITSSASRFEMVI